MGADFLLSGCKVSRVFVNKQIGGGGEGGADFLKGVGCKISQVYHCMTQSTLVGIVDTQI